MSFAHLDFLSFLVSWEVCLDLSCGVEPEFTSHWRVRFIPELSLLNKGGKLAKQTGLDQTDQCESAITMWQPISSEHRVLHRLWRWELRGYRSTINVESVYICDLQRPLFRSEWFCVVCTGTEHKRRAQWRQNGVLKAFQVKLFGN